MTFARGNRGFSLIELLVAMLIAVTVVLGFAGGTLAVMKANRVSEKQSNAAAVAQAKLADVTEALTRGAAVSTGDETIGEFTVTTELPAVGLPAGTTTVRVTVSWTAPSPGAFTFSTVVNTG